MTTETDKGRIEIEAFRSFLKRTRLPIDPEHVEKRPVGEPDLLCVHAEEGFIAFELASICDEPLAKVMAAGPKAIPDAFWTADPSAALVRRKLGRKYATRHPIELLLYTDGRVVTTEDEILARITSIVESCDGPFRRVWFMGEHTTCLVWQASDLSLN